MIGILEGSDKIARNGLIINFDAAQLRSYVGTGNTWYNLVNTTEDATLYNTPTYLTDNGGLLDFDGTNEYAEINGSAGNTPYGTIECWVKLDDPTGGGQHIIQRRNTDFGTFSIIKVSTTNVVRFGTRDSNNVIRNINSTDVATSDWEHYIGTYDGTIARFYRNNVEQGNISFTDTINTGGTFGQWIATQSGSGLFLNGKLPIVRVYDRGLSPDEVAQNFNALRGRFGV